MNLDKIKIVADSSCDMTSFEGIAFESAPLKIITSEKEYTDDVNIDTKEMVDHLQIYKGRSTTSCPNVADWLKCFGTAEYIFCVTITGTLSGSYNSACIAKEEYEKNNPNCRVHVINSLSTGPEMELLLEKIRELCLKGKEFDEVCAMCDVYLKKTGLLFMLESMKNLSNNGRVSPIAAKMAGILGIRVIGKASDRGDLEMLNKCRGVSKAISTMVENMKELGYRGGKVRIAHCFNEEAGNKLKELILKVYKDANIVLYRCGGLCSFYAEKGGMLVGFEK